MRSSVRQMRLVFRGFAGLKSKGYRLVRERVRRDDNGAGQFDGGLIATQRRAN